MFQVKYSQLVDRWAVVYMYDMQPLIYCFSKAAAIQICSILNSDIESERKRHIEIFFPDKS